LVSYFERLWYPQLPGASKASNVAGAGEGASFVCAGAALAVCLPVVVGLCDVEADAADPLVAADDGDVVALPGEKGFRLHAVSATQANTRTRHPRTLFVYVMTGPQAHRPNTRCLPHRSIVPLCEAAIL